jgi:hypothetical protein
VLTAVTDGIWAFQYAVGPRGSLQVRSTIVRLHGGGLFVHSPGPLSRELADTLDSLGAVQAVVAPNLWHHLFVNEWRDGYPTAQFHIAPRLGRKRKDLDNCYKLTDTPPSVWGRDIDQHVMRGVPAIGEVWFCHAASKTLIVTDLVHNMQRADNLLVRALYTVTGGYKKFGPTRIPRLLCRDRGALRASLDRVLDWNFDRVIVAHGDIKETGGKQGIRRGFDWVRS